MNPLTTADVQKALVELNLDIEITEFSESTATSELAAEAIGTTVSRIAKSIVFMVLDQPIVVITAGDQRVDDRKIAAHYDVGRKKVKIAKPEQCLELIGYAPGGVPPLGHRTTVPIFIDETLGRFTTIYAAAGSAQTIFPIAYPKLVEITNGHVMDVVRDE